MNELKTRTMALILELLTKVKVYKHFFFFKYCISYFIVKCMCTIGLKKMKHPYLFQNKLSYRAETGTNRHGLLSSSV